MNKKLIAKVQKLTAKLPEGAQIFSNALVIEPDDAPTLEKHGVLYSVYSVMGTAEMDTLLTTKVVNDVLHDVYFQHESPSPIQSLERAVAQVKEKIVQLSKEVGNRESDFSIIVAALWGNVLYVVQYGKGGCFLMREGILKPINSASEGNFTVASGIVKDGDVVLLGSKGFLEKYPPEKLISTTDPVSQQGLPLGASSLILKFVVDTTFSKDEVIDIRSEKSYEEQASIGQKSTGSLGKSPKKRKSIKNLLGPHFSLKQTSATKKDKKKFLIPGIIFLLAISIYMTTKNSSSWGNFSSVSALFSKTEKTEELPKQQVKPVNNKATVEGMGDEEAVNLEEQKISDEKNKVARVDADVFYDLALTKNGVVPSELRVLDTEVVVASESGEIFTSNLVTPKFVQEETSFPGINSIGYYSGDVSFVDAEGFKVYSLTDKEVIDSYLDTTLSKINATYLDFIYSISNGTITKYTKEGTVLEGTDWGTFEESKNATDMAINVSIYVLTKDNLYSFTSGVKDAFVVSGLDKPLLNAAQVVVDEDFDNIYVLDKGNSRILVLDDKGTLIKQYINKNTRVWSNLKSIGVSRDEATLYILNDTKVYEVKLE